VREHTFVPFEPADDSAYAYLLGWYLGDGCISNTGRAYQLVITADLAYFWIIVDCCQAIRTAVPGRIPRVRPHRVHNCVRIETGWIGWPEAFPQHGPGRKHERPIVLEPWQRRCVEGAPWAFLRGCFRADGCVFVNRTGRYEYVSYDFRNRSSDILDLFSATCDLVGVEHRRYAERIRVYRRASVALLMDEIGVKR
jgi:hypothetical protein